MIYDFENENEDTEDSQELARIQLHNAILISDAYYDLHQVYIEFVAQHKLGFFHKLKFRKKTRISEPEARIIAVQKGISIKDAKKLASIFNKIISLIKNNDAQKSINKLLEQINDN